jgi:phage baseplate assembly protein W|tara:strand:- start:43361 stop:43762 length:402 start_codon:yes stop_codon:yes gene_type:complete
MPLERVKQEFKDISMSFQTNPLNDDLVALKNANAIARSIRNIVFTEPGEKFFNPDFGSRITKSLFENVDEIAASAIKDEIEFSIQEFEPRVELIEVTVVPNFDSNEMNATIVYEIVGIDVPPQQLEFVLLPTR